MTRTSRLIDALPDAVLVCDSRWRIQSVNSRAVAMLGHAPADLRGRDLTTVLPSVVPPAAAAGVGTARAVHKDGSSLAVHLHLATTHRGQRSSTIVTLRDATVSAAMREALIRTQSALRESDLRFRTAFDHAPIGMCMVGLEPDNDGRVLRVNDAMCRLLRSTADRLVGGQIPAQWPRQDGARAEVQLLTPDGEAIWLYVSVAVVSHPDGRPAHAIAQLEDTTARRRAEAELTYRASHDVLTGLANRALLMDRLTVALARAADLGSRVGVIFLDVDNLKVVNDSLGHDVGDELLQTVAHRLTQTLRETDTAARLGGDEFVIVCEDLQTIDQLEHVARRLELALRAPFEVAGTTLRVSASQGLALSQPDEEAETVLTKADSAMYAAKRGGKARFERSSPELHARALRQVTVEHDLRLALARQQFALLYQPCVDLGPGGEVVAAEALLRWRHPVLGLLTPDSFLDVAEEGDLINDLGSWVLERACEQAALWHRRLGTAAPEVWVNISSRQLGRHHLATRVEEVLERTGLPAARLVLELTEHQAVQVNGAVMSDLAELRALGVRLAIDDFGTGHNGLDYLRWLAADILKIDRTFVAGLGSDATDTALTTSMVTLGRSLGLTVVAEGVETREQYVTLQSLGCHLAQGYLLGRPAAAGRLMHSALPQRSTA